jgi:hypothetical protein
MSDDSNVPAIPTDEQMDLYKNVQLAQDIKRAARFVAICKQDYDSAERVRQDAQNKLVQAQATLHALIAKLA